MSAVSLFVIMRLLVAMTCMGGAVVMAVNERGGWGWLVFVGLLCCCFGISMGNGKAGTDDE